MPKKELHVDPKAKVNKRSCVARFESFTPMTWLARGRETLRL